jgi:threonine aldolase
MIVDLRSDTVTKPSKEMLEAMFSAQVGDDVYGEDPSINELEEYAASLFGHEEAVFAPSGIMTNQLAIKTHTVPGDEVICHRLSHIYNYEGGGIAFHSGSSVRLIEGNRGIFGVEDILKNINPDDVHYPSTSLVSVENTVNKGGGAVFPFETLKAMSKVCKENGLKFHVDGARLFNALVATGETAKQHGELFDSISICLSKGLGAPVGSLLIGNKEFAHRVRHFRRMFGGGMRQAGFLAAAGLYALKNNVDRLEIDHQNARVLAEEASHLSFVKEVLKAETNIVIFEVDSKIGEKAVLKKLAEKNIKASAFGANLVRMVTHLDFTTDMLNYVVETMPTIKF